MVTIDSIKPPQMGLAEKSLIPKSKEDLNSILKELSTDGNSIEKQSVGKNLYARIGSIQNLGTVHIDLSKHQDAHFVSNGAFESRVSNELNSKTNLKNIVSST